MKRARKYIKKKKSAKVVKSARSNTRIKKCRTNWSILANKLHLHEAVVEMKAKNIPAGVIAKEYDIAKSTVQKEGWGKRVVTGTFHIRIYHVLRIQFLSIII